MRKFHCSLFVLKQSCTYIICWSAPVIIIIIIIIIIIKIMTKCRGRSGTPTTTNTDLFVTLYNVQKLLTNITKSSILDIVLVLYVLLKRLIHCLIGVWWVGVDHAVRIPSLELSSIWFLKNTCNSNINQHKCNDNNSNTIITRLK